MLRLLPYQGGEEVVSVSGELAKADCKVFEPDRVSITMSGGVPNAADVSAFARREKAARETQERLASENARRQAYLAKLPLLNSRSAATFVGSDRKCAVQFQHALAMDGLEKRKRIAELVSYGCGIVVEGTVHVQVETTDRDYATVTIAEGKFAGKSGWVPTAWLK